MAPLQIRDAHDRDRDALRELTLAAYTEYAARMPPPYWERYRQGILSALEEARPADQIVAEENGVPVGTVILYPAGSVFTPREGVRITLPAPELRLLAVAPAARGRGIGKALVHECIGRARRAGAATLMLHTTDMMVVAMRMYEALGFERAVDLDFHPAPDWTVKGYRLHLPPA